MDGMWDTHIHCLDPIHYPYKSTRAYTPPAAPLEDLISSTPATQIVLVQASVEDGFDGLTGHLARIRTEYPKVLARGIICMDENWSKLKTEDFDNLHALGVRYCRIHGVYGGVKTDAQSLQRQIRHFATSYPSTHLNWGLSAQFPLAIWSSLKSLFLEDADVKKLQIIADHVGNIVPSDLASPVFKEFLEMVRVGRLNVKISALYRRCGADISKMKSIVQNIADTAPSALIWGSDWPHVDASPVKSTEVPPTADIKRELSELQDWLSNDQFRKMLVDNPQRLFGA
ncbi:hypothetical protein BDV41DRAFT_590469 [Aspergillus transmontanensis]|uniref:Amidohydrolase-related domain-containing protein n=1 Tax=Aspergillus transmontanensis TaxID=1034304 RepID=A0A5N6VQA0_9EURO|nr:hypothetical protein BDV41DRAFT_590469 [Aspergillus transmontanensis]